MSESSVKLPGVYRLTVGADSVAILRRTTPESPSEHNAPGFGMTLLEAIERVTSHTGIAACLVLFEAGAEPSMQKCLPELLNLVSGRGTSAHLASAVIAALEPSGAVLRKIELAGKPFAAAIHGPIADQDLELALACHARFMADTPDTRAGFGLAFNGVVPYLGATQRLPRLIGVERALGMLLQRESLDAQGAVAAGLIMSAEPPGLEIDAALTWLRTVEGHAFRQPWDQPGFRVPGGSRAPYDGFAHAFIEANAVTHARTLGLMPAHQAILSAVFEGIQVPFDLGLEIERKHSARLLASRQTAGTMRTTIAANPAARMLGNRTNCGDERLCRKLGIIGAGMMGAGIAAAAAWAGVNVVLVDRTEDTASAGRMKAIAEIEKMGGGDVDRIAHRNANIVAAADFTSIADCDLVIEAVFEDRAIKADVIRRAEAVLGESAVLATNTSTLPITSLAGASIRPNNLIGMHFFSPVMRMPLVEIIRGQATGDAALAAALGLVAQLGKTPIVVNDRRGFYTSRCFRTYLSEGAAMLTEGVLPALIENAGRQAGYPVGPLALSDEVSLELGWSIFEQRRRDLGGSCEMTPAEHALRTMLDLGRAGKKSRAGYYQYPEDAPKRLWPGLAETFKVSAKQPSAEHVRIRLLWRQVVECLRCLDEGVIENPTDGDVGAILAWGFPRHTGGPFSLVDFVTAPEALAQLTKLQQRYGERFAAPQIVREMASGNARFFAR